LRLLVTSIVRQSEKDEQSGWLYGVDLDDTSVLKKYAHPESAYLPYNQNPRGGLRGSRGMATSRNGLFIANDTDIRVYTPSWDMELIMSHPSCSDIHDIRFEDNSLWVTSTCNGLVFRFSRDGRLEDSLNYREFPALLRRINQRLSRKEFLSQEGIRNGTLDFRDPRNYRIDVFDKIHLNSLCVLPDGDLMLLAGLCLPWRLAMLWHVKSWLKRWGLWESIVRMNQACIRAFNLQRQPNSQLAVSLPSGMTAVIRMSNGAYHSVPLVLSDTTVPNHTLVPQPDGSVLMADTNTGHLLRFDAHSGTILQRIFVADGFLRGLERLSPTLVAVGCQNALYLVDLIQEQVVETIQLDEDERVAVFDVQVIPEHFDPFPETWPTD